MVASSRDLTRHVSRNDAVSKSGRYGANALLMETEMPPQAIESRVEQLEEHVTNLQELPHRMGALSVQISQLREDLGAQISQLREDLGAQISRLREDAGVQSSATERTLREEIIAGDERILAQVRVLHEDVVSRLALIQEGQPRPRKRRN